MNAFQSYCTISATEWLNLTGKCSTDRFFTLLASGFNNIEVVIVQFQNETVLQKIIFKFINISFKFIISNIVITLRVHPK